MPTQKEHNENLIEILKRWQNIEDASIRNTSEIIKKADNSLIQLIMDIIRQDSFIHRRVQQMIIDNFTSRPLSMTPEELGVFWEMVEEHNEIEKKTIHLAEEALVNTQFPLVKYLLEYLLIDERKHDRLIDEMEKIKSKMYPYG